MSPRDVVLVGAALFYLGVALYFCDVILKWGREEEQP